MYGWVSMVWRARFVLFNDHAQNGLKSYVINQDKQKCLLFTKEEFNEKQPSHFQ